MPWKLGAKVDTIAEEGEPQASVYLTDEQVEDPTVTCWLAPDGAGKTWICAPDHTLSGFRSGEETHDDGY